MGIRTGRQFLDRLDARTPIVYVNGEKITSKLASHPAFTNIAKTFGELYDLQSEPGLTEVLTVPGSDGERLGASFHVPRNTTDLQLRRRATMAWADHSQGFLGRTGDYLNSALTALSTAEPFFGETDSKFFERIQAYYTHVRDNDLLLAHTLIPPQVNRADSAFAQGDGEVAARVVEERDDGIVVRGARMLATIGPIADELLVFPSTVLRTAPEDVTYAFAFAIPTDTPGLKFYCRTPLARNGGEFDEPLASRFEEIDAVVVFDDVFVPNERIFLLGRPDLCNAFYTRTGAAALMTHQVLARTLTKTEFFLGLASNIARAIGIDGFQHIQQDLAELITYVELQKALLRTAEVDGSVNDAGIFLPKWETLNAARNWFPTRVAPRLTEIVRKFAASGLMALPGESDFETDGAADLDQYFQSATLSARERSRLFKLAADASVSGFAGRQELYERFFFGDPVRMATALVGTYSLDDAHARVVRMLEPRMAVR